MKNCHDDKIEIQSLPPTTKICYFTQEKKETKKNSLSNSTTYWAHGKNWRNFVQKKLWIGHTDKKNIFYRQLLVIHNSTAVVTHWNKKKWNKIKITSSHKMFLMNSFKTSKKGSPMWFLFACTSLSTFVKKKLHDSFPLLDRAISIFYAHSL